MSITRQDSAASLGKERQARDKRLIRDALLVALTVSTGAVDAISWLALGQVFAAFMTGNLVFLGFEAVGAGPPSTLPIVIALAAFAIGAALTARMVTPSESVGAVWPRRVTVALGIVAVVQAVFLVLWLAVSARPSDATADVLVALLAFAMGVQTSAIFSLGVRAVFITAATATWTALMGDLANWSRPRGERLRLAAVVVGVFVGALVGAVLVVHARVWAPVLPLAIIVVVVIIAAIALRGGDTTDH